MPRLEMDVYRTRVEIAAAINSLGAGMWVIGGVAWVSNGMFVDPSVAAVGRAMFFISLLPLLVSVARALHVRAWG